MLLMYITIPEAFAIASQGHRKNENEFNYAITNDGTYVCSANSINEFPELFAGLEAEGWISEPTELDESSFPERESQL